jgi:hypothetical protein
VLSPLVRERIRWIAGLWLAWTVAGLLYITQETVPRLYRGEPVPWTYVLVGWMTGMYVCAALTPAVLSLGRRWPVERRPATAPRTSCSASSLHRRIGHRSADPRPRRLPRRPRRVRSARE